jgi:hypothetical protein
MFRDSSTIWFQLERVKRAKKIISLLAFCQRAFLFEKEVFLKDLS